MKTLHSKILELRKKVGTEPILFAGRKNNSTKNVIVRSQVSPENDRLLRQYFCIWGVPDDYGTMPIKGCFSKSLNDRGPKSNASYKITALYMHNQSDSVGMPLVLEEDEVGLYGEVPILEGIEVCDALVIRHKSGTCNNGSYGFHYIWDKMEYDEANNVVVMKECDLFEVSFVTIGSQTGTFGVRGADGVYTDETLADETELLIKSLPRKNQLEVRSLLSRHISLARNQPLESRDALENESKPIVTGIDYNYLLNNLKIS